MTVLVLGNNGPRNVELRFDLGQSTFCLKIKARDEIEVMLPAEAIGAIVDQNRHVDLAYARNAPSDYRGVWYDLRSP